MAEDKKTEQKQAQIHENGESKRDSLMQSSEVDFKPCFHTKNNMTKSKATEEEEEESSNVQKRGGWRTLPFVLGNEVSSGIAVIGLNANMIVYLIKEYHMKNLMATHIINISNGASDLSPLVGAFISDSYLGRFWAIAIGSVLSLIAVILLMLTAIISSLRPPPCKSAAAETCRGPSKGQFAVLCVHFAISVMGSAGVRYNSSAFGADQFDRGTAQGAKQIQRFFNWYYALLSISIIVATTFVVYIQDNLSWSWGFGICTILTGISMVLFLAGTNLYLLFNPKSSPFTGFTQVLVASLRKKHLKLPSNAENYYHEEIMSASPLTQQLKFLNKAAIKTEQDFEGDGSRKPWRLCTVEQVEDLKSIVKTLPMWVSAVLLGAVTVQQRTFGVLQALVMERHVSNDFQVPAASFIAFSMFACAAFLVFYDKMCVPWAARMGIEIKHLPRIGVGIVLYGAAMGVAAVVQSKRRRVGDGMSAFWLVPQYVLIGLGEAFHGVGLVDFFYSQFPHTVRSTASTLVGASNAVGFYLNSFFVSVLHKRNVGWLMDDLDKSRLDYFYALLCGIQVLNLVYFLVCARWYTYRQEATSPEEGTA